MTNIGVYTAQNIFINFKPAGIGDRMAAFLIDIAVMVAYILGMSILFTEYFNGWMAMVFMLPIMVYHPIFEYIMNGQSPGKRQLKIRVLKEEGQPVTVSSILLRWLLSPIDFMFSGGIAISSIVFTSKAQRLGDLAAGTIVVKEKKLDDYNKNMQHIALEEGYEPSFPSVKVRLTQKDIDLIQDTLRVRVEQTLDQPAEKIRAVIENKLEIKSDKSTVNFLHTVVKDFKYYNTEEEISI